MFIDTHCHLDMEQFDPDRAAVIERAADAGVTQIIDPGTDIASSQVAVELAGRYPGQIYAAVGIHPHEASGWNGAALDELRRLARLPGVVAIGEIGLDYYRDHSPRDLQRAAFTAQLDLASEMNLPVIIHNRDASEDLLELIAAHQRPVRGVFHCFLGDLALARRCLALGCYLSFAGPLTFKNSTLPVVAKEVPLDRVLIETDSPYLAPHPLRGKRNEPKNVALVAQHLGHLRGIAVEELAATIQANVTQLFGVNRKDTYGN